MTTDGRSACALASQATVPIVFEEGKALLAQAPGATFYTACATSSDVSPTEP